MLRNPMLGLQSMHVKHKVHILGVSKLYKKALLHLTNVFDCLLKRITCSSFTSHCFNVANTFIQSNLQKSKTKK